MDANQTRFHLLLGEPDWKRCTGPGLNDASFLGVTDARLVWDAQRNVIRLRSKLLQYVASPGNVVPRLGSKTGNDSDRRGAARDRFGNWYFIAADRLEVLVYSAGCRETTHFWSTNDCSQCRPPVSGTFQPVASERPQQCPPRLLGGLTVTEDHYLVVGVLEPQGLLVFDLHAGGPPIQLLWPKQLEFVPFDMAPRPKGGVWILDRKNSRYWALDRHFRVLTRDQWMAEIKPAQPDLFQSVAADVEHCSDARHFPTGISLDDASPVAATDPIAIEALPDGKVLILDANPGQPFSQVLAFEFGTQIGQPALPDRMAEEIEVDPEKPFTLRAYDFAFVAQTDPNRPQKLGQLALAAEEGNQTFAFELRFDGNQFSLEPLLEYFPMRLFSGMGLVAAEGELFYDSNRRWIPLRGQIRPRYEPEAVFWTPVFDGREPQCVWHRLLLDACVPPDTAVEISSRAADEKNELAATAWQEEPGLYRRSDGSELPFTPPPTSESHGTFELLFQKAKGRYLQIQVRVAGNGRVSPRLRALRAYYPRFSYLNHYLPAVYREEAVSASFLDRFLANLEGFNTATEDRIVAARMLFDQRSAPSEALEWLASWFGVALDPAWDELRRRLFIRHAMEFFQWRGTPHGLRMTLRLAFDEEPNDSIFVPPGVDCGATARASRHKAVRCQCGSVERYRIVERFRTRRRPSVLFGDPTTVAGPRQTLSAGRWSPEKGLAELNQRYQTAVGRTDVTFSLEVPDDSVLAAARATFAERELGFVPSDDADDLLGWQNFLRSTYSEGITKLQAAYAASWSASWSSFELVPLPGGQNDGIAQWAEWRNYQQVSPVTPYARKRKLWQEYLKRRHNSVDVLNSVAVHGSDWESLETVGYPTSLRDGALLYDWFQFESVVLPTLEAAHQFTVLLPFVGGLAADTQRQREQLRLAGRLVELEKPAHTTYVVKFYWAMFRLGEARLGQDTQLGLGGRDPALLPPAVLGQTYLAESHLAASHPFNVQDRQVVGRDRLKQVRKD